MQKIISLFQRNYDGDKLVRNEVVPGAEWVLAGEGVATRKFDGTCCLIRGGKLFKRYEAKVKLPWEPGMGVVYLGFPPYGFEPATDPDPTTGKRQGWVPVGEGPEDRWHREAKVANRKAPFSISACREVAESPDGTYELIGPKIQGNVEGFATHVLLPHGCEVMSYAPRDYDGLKAFLSEVNIEGLVWHHPDGRMVKIKGKDFGIKRRGGK